MNNNEELEIDLHRLFRALWRKAWAILLATFIFGSTFFVGSALFIKPLYEAEIRMYVNSSSSFNDGKTSISQAELSAAKTLVDTYIVILNSRTTIDAVIEQSGVPYTYKEIQSNEMISASAVNGTEIFSVVVTSENATEAALMANTIAEVLPGKISDIVEGSSARIVDYAEIPIKPSSPNTIKNAAVGAVLGFVLACSVVIIADLMDNLIHDSDYLSDTYHLPVLAVIPDLLSTNNSGGYYRQTESTNKTQKRGTQSV